MPQNLINHLNNWIFSFTRAIGQIENKLWIQTSSALPQKIIWPYVIILLMGESIGEGCIKQDEMS